MKRRHPQTATLAEELRGRGWLRLPAAVERPVAQQLVAQLASELQQPSVPPESGTPRVSLADSGSWPRGGMRRLVECTPPGVGAHWVSLLRSPVLVAALDELLGEGAWELRPNEPAYTPGQPYVRQWYAPVAFPETSPTEDSGRGAGRALTLGDEAGWRSGQGDDWAASEDNALLAARAKGLGWKEVAKAVGGGRGAKQCRERWCGLQPWSEEEDAAVLALHSVHGPAWAQLAQKLPGERTKRQIRVRVASLLRAAEAAEAAVTATPPVHAVRPHDEWEAVNRRRVRRRPCLRVLPACWRVWVEKLSLRHCGQERRGGLGQFC
jgi:hypothetical protein